MEQRKVAKGINGREQRERKHWEHAFMAKGWVLEVQAVGD